MSGWSSPLGVYSGCVQRVCTVGVYSGCVQRVCSVGVSSAFAVGVINWIG